MTPAPQAQLLGRLAAAAAIILCCGLVFGSFLWFAAQLLAPLFYSRPAEITARKKPTAEDILVKSRELMRPLLLTAKTAEFADEGTVTKFVENDELTVWRVHSHVDAQNSLGVYLRASYRVDISFRRDESEWNLERAFLNDELVFASKEELESRAYLLETLNAVERANAQVDDPDAPWIEIARFEGEGDCDTATFDTTRKKWRVRWGARKSAFDGEKSMFVMMVARRKNRYSNSMASGAEHIYEPTTGITEELAADSLPGEHYLEIDSFGCKWTAIIEEQQPE